MTHTADGNGEKRIANLKYQQTRASEGQFVRVEYAATEDGVFRRTTDLSDGEMKLEFLDADEIEGYFDHPSSHWAYEGLEDDLPWEKVNSSKR